MSKIKASKSSKQLKKSVHVIKKQNLKSRISAQFDHFKQQNIKDSLKREHLVHDQLKQHRQHTPNDKIFDYDDFYEQSQAVTKQGGKQHGDTRQQVKTYDRYPYNCYGKVKAQYKGVTQNKQQIKRSYGIAAFIGKGLMMTAAHVVPDQLQGMRLPSIKVYFQYSQTSLQVQRVLYHPQYHHQLRNKISPFDMALLVLKPNSQFPYPSQFLSISWDYSPKDYPQSELRFITFRDKEQTNWKSMELLMANHSDIKVEDQWRIMYKNTTYKGDSGSLILWWRSERNEYKVVGIHIGEQPKFNYGTLLTQSHSPKDIFTQIIQRNISLQRQKQHNPSQRNNTNLQNNQQPPVSDFIQLLENNMNYQQSTEKYIQKLEKENKLLKNKKKSREKQNRIQNSIIIKKQQQRIQKPKGQLHQNENYSYLSPTKTQRNRPRQTYPQYNQYYNTKETPKKNQLQKKINKSQSINQKSQQKVNQNNTSVKVGKTQTIKKKQPIQHQGQQSKGKPKSREPRRKKQQQDCLVKICQIISNWMYRRPAAIANLDQTSSVIPQN